MLPAPTAEQRARGSAFLLGLNFEDRERYFKRSELVRKLQTRGFPISERTLASLAARNDGPPFYRFGRKVLYRWFEVLNWAESNLKASTNQRHGG
jgi:hypothetical protein